MGFVLATDGLICGAALPELYAWDLETGEQRWRSIPDARISDFPGALVIGPEGNLYVSTSAWMEAFDGSTGAKLWNSPVRGPLAVGPDGTIYVAGQPFTALDPVTGATRWSSASVSGNEYSPPALSANGLAYLISGGGIAAVNTRTGDPVWHFTPSGDALSRVIVAGDGTVLASGASAVIALEGGSGKKLWQFQGGGTLTDIVMSPDRSVCVAHDGSIVVRDLQTGEVQRRLSLQYCERAKLAFAEDGTLYVVTRNYAQQKTQLLALDFATGQTNWVFEPHDYEANALAVGSDGAVYFHNGYFYAVYGSSPLANSAWPQAHQNAQNTSYWKVSGAPQITRQPRSRWAAVDSSAAFHFYTPVSRPLHIQWRFNGQPIQHGTNETLVIEPVQFDHAGTYSVAVSNQFGSIISEEATLSVGYALNTTAVGPGMVRRVPDLEVYPINSIVEITAVPGRPNHAFIGWSGDAAGNVQTLVITLDRNYAITAEFEYLFPDAIWTNDFGDAPAIGTNGYLYAFSEGYITAIDTRDGRTVFKDHYFDSWWAPGALGLDGTLYIGNYSGGSVWAHDGTTGEPKGGFTVDICVHACPAIGVDGTLYLAGRHLYAADPAVYRQFKWVFQGGNTFESSPAVGANGLVYAGCYDGKMYAVNARTGTKVWEFMTGDLIYSSPALGSDGTVYFGSHDGNVYALNGETGEKRWEFATGGNVAASPIIGPDGTVYIGSMDNKIYALDGSTGTKRWEFLAGGGVPHTGALAADGTLYIGPYALNSETGAKIWQFPAGGTPTIGLDGTIYTAGYAFYGTSPLAASPWPKFHATLDNAGRFPGRPVLDARASHFSSQGFALTLYAEIGDALNVEWSTNLIQWTHLARATNTTGRVELLDPAATSTGQRFYRASVIR